MEVSVVNHFHEKSSSLILDWVPAILSATTVRRRTLTSVHSMTLNVYLFIDHPNSDGAE